MNPIWIAIIAAAVGGTVSTVITEIGRGRERKSRREELALTKAYEISQAIYSGTIELIKADRDVLQYPLTMIIRDNFRMFKHLLDHGTLDPQAEKKLDEVMKRHSAAVTGGD